MKNVQYIAKFFNLDPRRKGNVPVHCPFHEDAHKSAGINFEKRVFNCLSPTCVGGLSFYQLYRRIEKLREEKLTNESSKSKVKIKTPELDINFQERAVEYLEERGLDPDNIPIFYEGCSLYTIDDKPNPFYGFLIFESIDGYISGRNIIYEDELKENIWKVRPKYMNEPNPKGLFWVSRNEKEKVVFLVEGVFDALSLYEMGVTNIAVLGGAHLDKKSSDKVAFGFRNKTVIILLDNDPEGYKGSKSISEKLSEYNVDHHILEIPEGYGKDLNEFLINSRPELKTWLANVLDRFHPNDKRYVRRLFREKVEPLNVLPSGISELDRKLTGGFKDGGHIISGTTGIGKTSFVFDLAVNGVLNYGKRVMINSCEISKRQSYARIASQFSDYTWEELEEDPLILEDKNFKKVQKISENLLVVNGWPLSRIIQEAKDYDVIIIDYIQRVREAYGSDESATRHLINNYVSKLTDLGALAGKICIMISSLGRASYDKPDDYGLKESGSLEYMGTSVSRISVLGDPKDGTFIWRVQKNTRGDTGLIKLRGVNLGHSLFRDCKAEVMGDV